jgi:hypothetical protein
MIKSHADFKRLLSKPDTRLETLALANLISGGRLQVGQIRKITKADTTGVYLQVEGEEGRGSFLGFDKASDWTFTGDVATASWGGSYRIILGEGESK